MNLLELQKKILAKRTVSIPELQRWLGFDYADAKAAVKQMQARGWLEAEPTGVHYVVQPEYCVMRELELSELDELLSSLDRDCSSALSCLTKNTTATYADLLAAVCGDEDTNETIETLKSLRLIYRYQDCWRLTVSKKTAALLRTVIRQKCSSEAVARHKLEAFLRGGSV